MAVAAKVTFATHPNSEPRFSFLFTPISQTSATFRNKIRPPATALRGRYLREENHAYVRHDENFAERGGEHLKVVFKFGGSSLASADDIRRAAQLLLRNRHQNPVVALSAMSDTAQNLLIAGEKAVCGRGCGISYMPELQCIEDLHVTTARELGIECSVISKHLVELRQLLCGLAMMRGLTHQVREFLVSLGDRMCVTLFAAHLNNIGARARLYDFSEARNLASVQSLHYEWAADPAIPVVTNYLKKTLDIRGSNPIAMTIGKALGLPEIELWKEVDGFKSNAALPDPRNHTNKHIPDRSKPDSTSVHLPDIMSRNEADDEKCPMPTTDEQNTIGAGAPPCDFAEVTNPALVQSLRDFAIAVVTSFVREALDGKRSQPIALTIGKAVTSLGIELCKQMNGLPRHNSRNDDPMPDIYQDSSENYCSMSADDHSGIRTRTFKASHMTSSNHNITDRSEPGSASVHHPDSMSQNEEADYEKCPMPTPVSESIHSRRSKSCQNRGSNNHQESKKSGVGSAPAHCPANSHQSEAWQPVPSIVKSRYQVSTSTSSPPSFGSSTMRNNGTESSSPAATSSTRITIGYNKNCGSGTQKTGDVKCTYAESELTQFRDFNIGDINFFGGINISYLNGVQV